jgi:hypothetical protein
LHKVFDCSNFPVPAFGNCHIQKPLKINFLHELDERLSNPCQNGGHCYCNGSKYRFKQSISRHLDCLKMYFDPLQNKHCHVVEYFNKINWGSLYDAV